MSACRSRGREANRSRGQLALLPPGVSTFGSLGTGPLVGCLLRISDGNCASSTEPKQTQDPGGKGGGCGPDDGVACGGCGDRTHSSADGLGVVSVGADSGGEADDGVPVGVSSDGDAAR